MYSDFCSIGETYLQTKLNSKIIQTAQFYSECNPSTTTLKLPPSVPVLDLAKFYSTINENQHKLNIILSFIFNRSQEVNILFFF